MARNGILTGLNVYIKIRFRRRRGQYAQDQLRELVEEWTTLSAAQKNIYKLMAREQKKLPKRLNQSRPGAHPTGYMLFTAEESQTYQGETPQATFRNIGAAWRTLSARRKKKFNEKARMIREERRRESKAVVQ